MNASSSLLLRVNHGCWCQESYITSSRAAGKRARMLRKQGYAVTVSSLGFQVGPNCNVSLVDIRPGSNDDTTAIGGGY